MNCNDRAMNFMNIVHELMGRNMYLESKLDEVCEQIEIMSKPKPCTLSNTEDVPPSNKVKAIVKEEAVELLHRPQKNAT